MRVLAIGNFSHRYMEHCWRAPLRRLYPDSLVVDTAPLLAVGDGRGRFCHQYILGLLRNDTVDCVLFFTDGGIANDFPDAFFAALRQSQIPVIAIHGDDEPEVWYERNRRFDHRYDMVATHSRRSCERRRAEGWGERALYLPWGYNPAVFRRMPDAEKKYDIVFVGKNKQSGRPEDWFEDSRLRADSLVRLYELCRRQGLRFGLFGMGWEDHPILGEAAGGLVEDDAMVRIFNESKLVFNPSWTADNDFASYQNKLRLFEVAGSGACQLTNHNPDFAASFPDGGGAVYFSNVDELEQKVLYYLRHEEERARIALSALKVARSGHTAEHRVEALMAHVRACFSSEEGGKAREDRTEKGPGGGAASVWAGHPQQIQGTPVCVYGDGIAEPERAFVHLLPPESDLLSIESDYLPIRTFLGSDSPADVLTVRTIVEFPGQDGNFIQVNKENFNGCLLDSDGDQALALLPQDMADRLILPGTTASPLVGLNYLVRASRLDDFMAAVRSGSGFGSAGVGAGAGAGLGSGAGAGAAKGGRADLRIIHSHRIVNRVRFHRSAGRAFSFLNLRGKLDRLMADLKGLGKSVMIYGGRGALPPVAREAIERRGVSFLGYIDRALAGKSLDGHPVFSADMLESLQPDVVLVAATVSGPEIYENLSKSLGRFCVIPLYELEHPSWEIVY
ncbi:glycosyltransferase [Heliobacterium gestii]|uniref:Glycosyltransferase n=1 Tax=Heliomicrobium gestii TaxID=2699 RepID=A0A845LCD5_HELGE|nr:glycosyltransferase [Heliomicrobium gestii]MBM7866706.1 glycosyltransferase involved in cell wall biosynthesis [Heliomicrobium gestii]MZP43014.1 glycosyltransferase [Heliomicrobium gestii]